MKYSLIEVGLWVVAALVWWLAPPSWLPLAYALIGAAVIVAVLGYLASRRRASAAEADVAKAKRELEDLRKKL